MAEHWHNKPKAWIRLPAVPLVFPALSMDSNDMIKFLIDLGYQTLDVINWSPDCRSPCCESAQDSLLISNVTIRNY